MEPTDRDSEERGRGGAVVKHPAKFTPAILDVIGSAVNDHTTSHVGDTYRVLDPFGGVGGLFQLHGYRVGLTITCVEIEREWAEMASLHPDMEWQDAVICADFHQWSQSAVSQYDFVITSPAYGNRMADHHDAKDTSKRNTYRHVLGRELSPNSSAAMQWGPEYRQFHRLSWAKVYYRLRPGGFFILNVKDHIRKGKRQPVAAWHQTTIKNIGFHKKETYNVPVKGNRQGENGDVRVDYEHVMVFQRPWQTAKGVEYAEQQIGDQS